MRIATINSDFSFEPTGASAWCMPHRANEHRAKILIGYEITIRTQTATVTLHRDISSKVEKSIKAWVGEKIRYISNTGSAIAEIALMEVNDVNERVESEMRSDMDSIRIAMQNGDDVELFAPISRIEPNE